MHSDELRKLNESIEDPALYKIINELITRSDLQTDAIVAMDGPDGDDVYAKVKALTAHVAPKKKYTVEDIKRGIDASDWHYIYCGEYGYSTGGWCKQRPNGSYFMKEVADAIYAGLVATNNIPEEYR